MACRNPLLDPAYFTTLEGREYLAAHTRGEQVAAMTDALVAFRSRWPGATEADLLFAMRIAILDVLGTEVEIAESGAARSL